MMIFSLFVCYAMMIEILKSAVALLVVVRKVYEEF